MKKLVFLIVVSVLCQLSVSAQNKITIKDTFDSNKFQWDEFYEKYGSASIQDGYFVLQNKENETTLRSVTELPINVEKNFKVTVKLVVPKINTDYWFGIVFNYEDENNYSNFLVQEKKYKMMNMSDGTLSLSRKSAIILQSGKNKEVTIEMEKRGTKLIFSVDNMEVISITKPLKFNTFGFEVSNDYTLKVDEVIIEQRTED